MKKTRIAVVSTNNIHVNEHFGMAKTFSIYDVDERMTFVETRAAERLSTGDPKHPFDAEKFSRISALLKDCEKVYMTRIGEVPAAKLKELGIEPVTYVGAIEKILEIPDG